MINYTKKCLLILVLLVPATFAFAQTGIGTVTPHSSAALDVTSSTKGVLLPRLSNTQAAALAAASPAQGLLLYNTDRKCIQIYSGTSFKCLLTGSTGDSTNDAWINDSANTMVKLGTNSNGTTARTPGSEFVVRDNGYVGIGTASPSAHLYVNSTESTAYDNIASFLAPNNTKAGNASLISLGVANSPKNLFQMRYVYQASGNDSNRMDFGWHGVSNSTMTLLADGKVGIGTHTPSASLEVNGAVEISSPATVPDATPYSDLVWNTSTRRIETDPYGMIMRKTIYTVRTGATDTITTLTGNGSSAYEISVMVRNACGGASFNKFIVQGNNSNNNWTINFLGGMSASGVPTATLNGVTEVATSNPSPNCESNSGTTSFNYNLNIGAGTGILTLTNQGNITRNYAIKIEKIFY